MAHGASAPVPRRPSRPRLSFGLGDSLTMSTLGGGARSTSEKPTSAFETESQMTSRLEDFRSVSKKLMNSNSTMSSALEEDDDDDEDGEGGLAVDPPQHIHVEAARLLGRRLSDALMTPLSNPSKEPAATSSQNTDSNAAANADIEKPGNKFVTTHLISPANLAAQLYANPKLAALRSPSFGSSTQPLSQNIAQPKSFVTSPPIIMNPKCSGYFVQPVRSFSINSSRLVS